MGEHYERLTRTRAEYLDPIVARAAPQTLRLSLGYAALDCSPEVRPEHLRAALALWDFSEASAAQLFHPEQGSSLEERILLALQASHPQGKSTTQLFDLLGHRTKRAQLHAALQGLIAQKEVRKAEEGEGKHRKEVYYAVAGPSNS